MADGFDFDKAVEEAKHDFPEQTKNVTFVDLDAPDADQKLRDWVNSLSEKTKNAMQRGGALDAFTTTCSGFAFDAKGEDKKILAIHSHYCKDITMFQHAPEKQAAFVFDHELGHIVVPEADTATNKSENKADGFAIIRGLKRGSMDKKDAQLIADARAVDFFLEGDLVHLTTVGMDKLLVNHKKINFLDLTPAQIAQIAHKHGETFATDKDNRAELTSAFIAKGVEDGAPTQDICQKRLEQLGQVCLHARKNSLEFYVAARIVKTAMEHGGINNMPLDTSGPEWEKIAKVIDEKTKGVDLGAKLAVDKPLVEAETPGFMQRLRQKLSV